MKKYTVTELREMFLSFFESKGHLRLPSFSLIPQNDKSLLLINSGMAPLKPYFTGQEVPPRKRVTTCQKCIRTGDIDNIGHTARHGTFFEMLGNFSFGDYFKREAITWCWEFLTEVVGLDKDRLYPSIYVDDDEAFEIWNKEIGIDKDRIFRFGKEDNFWEHGSGPCGPCSEVYYDRGEKYGCDKPGCTVGCDCDRYMEVWNNVFTQFDNDGHNNYTELKQKNIDTGMGLERLAVVVQDAESIFEVDTNKELMDEISKITNCKYKENPVTDVSLRIIADHIKSCTFMVGDGILPSNEGRGYVLRRLLRRAVQHGRKLNISKPFMADLSKVVIKLNSVHYTDLNTRADMIYKVINAEEEKFIKTLDQGLEKLNECAENLIKEKKDTLSGDDAFKLYDTFGFPIDSTKEILLEKNIKVDIDRFNELMLEQKNKARNARKTTNYMGADATVFDKLPAELVSQFDGYDRLVEEADIKFIALDNEFVDEINEGYEAAIITEKTPFYPMMGGQVGDKGIIETDSGVFEVYDTIKVMNTKIAHVGKMLSGQLNNGDKVSLKVDIETRHKTAINHTATHLLHAALRSVLGTHVEQSGSYVDSERLRFDFTHFKAMTEDEIAKVEKIVNEKINESISVIKKEMSLNDAKKEGAMALFGEKYGETVRTVRVSDFSFELCGGTHIDNTNEIKYFKIVEEVSVAQGIRRIEAITYNTVIDFYENKDELLKNIELMLKSNDNAIIDRLNILIKEQKELKLENEKLKKQLSNIESNDIQSENLNGINLVAKIIDDKNMNELKEMSDTIKDKINDYAIVLVGTAGGRPSIVVSMSDTAVSKGFKAGDIIKQLAEVVGGKGGGREKFAQAGGSDMSKVQDIISLTTEIFKKG